MSTTCSCDSGKKWFCYPCEQLICESCKIRHENHSMEESGSLQQKLSSRLPSAIKLCVQAIPNLQDQIDHVDTSVEEMERRVNALKDQLKSRFEVLQAKLMVHHEKLRQEADNFLSNIKDKSNQKRELLQTKVSTIESIRDRCHNDDGMDIMDSLKLDDLCTRILDDVKNYSSITHRIPVICFSVTDNNLEKEIGELYGVLRLDVEEHQYKPNKSPITKSSEGLDVPKLAFPALPVRTSQKVSAIVQTSSNDIIIGYSTNKVINYFDRNAKKQKSRELPIYVQSMTSTSSGAVLVSENKGSKVMKIESNKIELFFDASPFKVFGVLCSKLERVVFVCCQSDENGHIYVITNEGKLTKIMKKSAGGEFLFQKPHRIAEHSSCRILYVTDPGQKLLKAINNHHQCLFEYSGGPERGNFIPIDVSFCPSINCMLVTNWKGNSVHQLSEDGSFMSLVVSQRDNLLYPTILLFDCLKRMWIYHKDKVTVLKCNFTS